MGLVMQTASATPAAFGHPTLEARGVGRRPVGIGQTWRSRGA